MSGRRRFGAIRKLSSGRWQARYRGPDGALRSAPVTFPTKTDAARWLTVAEADMARGLWHDPKRGEVSFRDVVALWLASKVNLRPMTMDGYRGLIELHIVPAFGDRPIGSITPLDVQTWLADRKANSKLAPNTLAKAYKILRAIMEPAVDAEIIARSPCRVKGAATERASEMRAATPDEVAAIAEVTDERWRALILLAAYSGLRRGALGGLRRRNIDLLHRHVQVTRQLTEIRGQLGFSTPKTAAGTRTVTLPAMIVEVLEEHLGVYGQPGPDGLVFVNPDGSPRRRRATRSRRPNIRGAPCTTRVRCRQRWSRQARDRNAAQPLASIQGVSDPPLGERPDVAVLRHNGRARHLRLCRVGRPCGPFPVGFEGFTPPGLTT